MAVAFSRTMRSLWVDSYRPAHVLILVLLILLLAWACWFFLATVTLYLVSDEARVEACDSAHVLGAPVAGEVVSVSMEIGRRVEAGETLLTLEAFREVTLLQEQEAQLRSLEERLAAMIDSYETELTALSSARSSDQEAVEKARASLREARSAADHAAARLARSEELLEQGLASRADLEEAAALAEQKEAEAEAADRELSRLQWQARLNETRLEAGLGEMRRLISELEGELEMARAGARRLDHEVEERSIRAPVAGRLGELTQLRPGSVVAQGERVAVLIPDGELQVVARYPSQSALGRVRPGQRARLRLHVYPWILYGELEALVARVGSEPDQRGIRVELTIERAPEEPVVLEHGLSGRLAVAVEQVSPAELLLRAVGQRLAGRQVPRPDADL